MVVAARLRTIIIDSDSSHILFIPTNHYAISHYIDTFLIQRTFLKDSPIRIDVFIGELLEAFHIASHGF